MVMPFLFFMLTYTIYCDNVLSERRDEMEIGFREVDATLNLKEFIPVAIVAVLITLFIIFI